MPQNNYSLFKGCSWGTLRNCQTKARWKPSRTNTKSCGSCPAPGAGEGLTSKELGSPSTCAASNTHSLLGWLLSVPPALFSWCPMVLPLQSEVSLQFRLHLHSFMQWLLTASLRLFQPCQGLLGLSGSTKPSLKTAGPAKPVNVAAKFCCQLGVMVGFLDHGFQQPLCVIS